MLKREKYKLSKNLTALKLRKNGFRNGAYRCNVYKDMFYFLMVINVDKEKDLHRESFYHMELL